METTQASSGTHIVRRVTELVPHIRAKAQQIEADRRIDDELIEMMADAGVFKLRMPARYGGHEADMRTLLSVISELGRGDGSVAWTAAVWSICSWLVGLFPDQVQDEVFAVPDARICGLLSPTGAAAPKNGGFVVNGRWAFNSGAPQSHWNVLIAMAPTPDGQQQWPVMAVVPMSELGIVDDWHTSGLCGTASVTTVASDLFVPAERVLPMSALLMGQYASKINSESPIYQTPLLPTACMSVTGTALGLARVARENLFERIPHRKITYTSYERQSDAPITHMQVAEAQMKLDEAEFHATRAATTLDGKGFSREPWTMQERAMIRLDASSACRLAKEAIDIYATASGASSIYHNVPMQRIGRDIHAINLHAILHPNTNLELYGRLLCGLEPNTVYL